MYCCVKGIESGGDTGFMGRGGKGEGKIILLEDVSSVVLLFKEIEEFIDS